MKIRHPLKGDVERLVKEALTATTVEERANAIAQLIVAHAMIAGGRL